MSNVTVIGTGYVGLTTGACFAHLGHQVICVDIDEQKIAQLSSGHVPIHEDGLESLVNEGLETGRLRFVLGASSSVAGADFVYLCVPTPQADDGSADLSYIEAAAMEISAHLDQGTIVVTKSTVPVGSTILVENALKRDDIPVVSNPEFLREGTAVSDFLHPDRVVVGSDDHNAAQLVAGLYLGVQAPILITDPASAETAKYASNAFLATKLSFVNAVAAVCEAVGANVSDVLLAMGYDERIGQTFLQPGPGWGGSCFPKDTKALIKIAEDRGYDFSLLRGVIEVNEDQFDRVADKIRNAAHGELAGKRIAVLGLAFKAGTDDTRSSPALEVLRRLLAAGAHVAAYDPAVSTLEDELADVEICADAYGACEGADVLAVLTEWPEFRSLNWTKVYDVMAHGAVVDARNLLKPEVLKRLGFSYEGIGLR
ncbi:MAG: UDP-glucose/GDP-mannose dehydrogenase family protein [Acidobacteria bacterium]|nr:UDP-glucose/GDP-mannose dehydrogenase family protein [Acidobacteriota bacterium]